jgi:hypothetical protein
MDKTKVILLVGGGLVIASAIGYYFYNKKGLPLSNLTPQQIFDQLYSKGAYLQKIDATAKGWTIDDLPFLNAWLDAANNGKASFGFNGATYTTVGGKKQ